MKNHLKYCFVNFIKKKEKQFRVIKYEPKLKINFNKNDNILTLDILQVNP